MQLYNQLLEKIGYLEEDKVEQILQAYKFALKVHSGQTRDSGEKYITHPLSVACILADMKLDYQSVIVGLLHDVVEDTQVTNEEIANIFGKPIADLVDGVTKLTEIEFEDRNEKQVQNFRKMVLAMSRDIRVILIKLSDRLHNMQTLECVSPDKRRRVAKETLEIYAPIANRLGMHNMHIELEDLAFAALYPKRYNVLNEAVDRMYGERQEVMKLIQKELEGAFHNSSIRDFRITGRAKHIYSIYNKMVNRKTSFVNIMDVYAFRVIVEERDDCYRALGIIHNLYKPFPGRFKDYIAIPKFNGYQSLHTVLFGPYGAPVEIQVCTKMMEQTGNNGVASHWLYKSGSEVMDSVHVRAQQWVSHVLEMQKNTSSSSEFFENLKVDLFPDKVYVFTPKGNIMEMPRGSTIVDFAYAIHTMVGNTCVAAKINKRFVPLSTALLNGQTVSVVTSKGSSPNPQWINFVVTSKARHAVRHYLKNKKWEDLVALGKQMLDKSISDLDFDASKISSKLIEDFCKKSGFESKEDMYKDIGLGNRLPIFVAHCLANAIGAGVEEIQNVKSSPLLIRGTEGIAITFANCCPIPGDAISGYLNPGSGLDIHVEHCIYMENLRLKHPERCVSVSWADDVSGSFCALLEVEVKNRVGVLADITKAISKANTSIDDISVKERNDKYIFLSIRLLVTDVSHFERVKRHVSEVPDVVEVVRQKGLFYRTKELRRR